MDTLIEKITSSWSKCSAFLTSLSTDMITIFVEQIFELSGFIAALITIIESIKKRR